MTKPEKKKVTPEEKLAILERHMVKGEPVSDISMDLGLPPEQFKRWLKEMFEKSGAVSESEGPQEKLMKSELEEKIKRLEESAAAKDEFIASARKPLKYYLIVVAFFNILIGIYAFRGFLTALFQKDTAVLIIALIGTSIMFIGAFILLFMFIYADSFYKP